MYLTGDLIMIGLGSLMAKVQMGKRPRRALTAAVMAGILMGACTTPRAAAPTPGATPFEISQSTNAALQEYFGLIGQHQRGAFAVSADGKNSYAYYCPDLVCYSNLFTGVATSQCESMTGQECIVLFLAREPRAAFTVAADKGIAGNHAVRRAKTLDEVNDY
jgi:hypothetical protein